MASEYATARNRPYNPVTFVFIISIMRNLESDANDGTDDCRCQWFYVRIKKIYRNISLKYKPVQNSCEYLKIKKIYPLVTGRKLTYRRRSEDVQDVF